MELIDEYEEAGEVALEAVDEASQVLTLAARRRTLNFYILVAYRELVKAQLTHREPKIHYQLARIGSSRDLVTSS